MIVAEIVATFLDLDQKADVFFAQPADMAHIYVVSKLPDGTRVMAEMPTAILKISQEKA